MLLHDSQFIYFNVGLFTITRLDYNNNNNDNDDDDDNGNNNYNTTN